MKRQDAVIDALRGGGKWTTIIAVILSGVLAVAEAGIIPQPFGLIVAPVVAVIGNVALFFAGDGAIAPQSELDRR